MAYERPKQWDHGDIPVDTDLNRYSNSLNALHPFFVARHFLTRKRDNDGEGVYFTLRKRYRWFHYIVASDNDDGELVDPGGVHDTIVLDKGDGTWQFLDLDSIEWLTPGKLYWVKDISIAMEAKFHAAEIELDL